MARKKIKNQYSFLGQIKWSESYTSLLLGVLVVIVGIFLSISFLKHKNIKQISATSTVDLHQKGLLLAPTPQVTPLEQAYTIMSGDDLWNIAERFYKSGDNWVDIAKANNLSDPSMIFAGDTLRIPQLSKVTPPQEVSTTESKQVVPENIQPTVISGGTYTVQANDSLWNIAIRAYGDGYRWVDVAKANNLSDPDLIYKDDMLKLPR